jgi:hypothetical protein
VKRILGNQLETTKKLAKKKVANVLPAWRVLKKTITGKFTVHAFAE